MTTNHKTSTRKASGNRRQAVHDLEGLIEDARALVKATSNVGEESVTELRTRLENQLELAKDQLLDLEESVKDKARGVDDYVHENPWQAIGIGVGVGFLVGALALRR